MEKMNGTVNNNCLYIINFIKEKFFFRSSGVSCKRIIEAIERNPLQELSDTNKIFIVIYLNNITK